MLNRKIQLVLLTACFSFLTLFSACAGGDKEKEPADAAKPTVKSGTGANLAVTANNVAKINDQYINNEELDAELKKYTDQYASQGQTLDEEQVHRLKINVLQTLINQKLLVQEFAKTDLVLEDSVVEEQLANLRKQFESDDAFREGIAKQGYTEETLRETVINQSKIQLMVNEAVKDLSLEDNEVTDYYNANPDSFQHPEMVRAAHILIKTEEGFTQEQKDEALEKITAIRQKILDGADFYETAKAESEGPSNTNGGDLGYFQRGQMVKPFEDVAFALGESELSDVVETQFGYHIITVLDHKEEGLAPFDEVKDQLTQQLLQQKQQKAFENYLLEVREGSTIEILQPDLKIE